MRFFDEYGYLILRNWIPQYLLKRLQDAASAWITMGSNVVERGGYEDDFKFAQRSYCSAGDAGNAS